MGKSLKWMLGGMTLLAGVVCLLITLNTVGRVADIWPLKQATSGTLGSAKGFRLVALIFAPAALLLPLIACRKLPPWVAISSTFVLGAAVSLLILIFVKEDRTPMTDYSVLALGVQAVGLGCGFVLSLMQRSERRAETRQGSAAVRARPR